MTQNYTVSVRQIANVVINSAEDYRGIFTKEKSIPSMFNINCENQTKALNVVFAKPLQINSTYCWNLKELGYNIININGNGSTIHAETKAREEFRWAITADENYILTASNIKVEGFNTAIINQAIFILNNVTLHNNKMDYICERDDGAGILNSGMAICNNCTFTNNYAKNGGAIFSQGELYLNNCIFNENTGYGTGNDILNVDNGKVFMNGEQVNGTQGTVKYVKSISDLSSSLITTVAGVGTILLGVTAGALGFLLSGGNVAVGIAVGVATGVIVGGSVGSYAAYAITSDQYNLAFNRLNTAISIISGTVAFGIEAGVVGAAMVGPCCKNSAVSHDVAKQVSKRAKVYSLEIDQPIKSTNIKNIVNQGTYNGVIEFEGGTIIEFDSKDYKFSGKWKFTQN